MAGVLDYPGLVYDVLTGKKREELEALRQDLAVQRKQIEGMTATVATMPDGPLKDQAWALRVKAQQAWQPVVREFNDAAIAHNDISAKLKAASFGAYDPGRVRTSLDGLGFLFIPAAVMAAPWFLLVVKGLIASGVLLALASLVDSLKSKNTEVKGYMSQFADVVNAGGGVIGQTGKLLGTATTTVLVLAGLYGVYYAAKWYQGTRGAKGLLAGAGI